MAPKLPFPSLAHRLRTAHPLAPAMRRSLRWAEGASAEEMRAFQERRLRRLVRWAERRTPYYRAWFAEQGVSASDIRTLDDLERLPLIDRDTLSADPQRFCAYPRAAMWAARSSGTSGNVVKVYRTPGASAYEINALQRQWGWFGVPRDARRLALRAGGAGLDGDEAVTRVVPGSQQMQVSAYVLNRADPDRLLREIRDFAPQAVEGWPSAIGMLAGVLHERGETLPVQAVITSSEVLTTQQTRQLEAAYEAAVVDHYGQTERVCLAGGCEAGGYHVFPDYGIVELLPVPGMADRWEIVGTPLHNWGFPLLRYRTGDTVGPAPEGPCRCGRSWPLLGPIAGRVEDSFVGADGRVIPLPGSAVDDVDGLHEVQVAQLGPGRFEVRMVPREGTDLETVRAQVMRNIDQFFGPGQQVGFVVLDRIPRAGSGKLKTAVLDPDGAESAP